MLKIGSIIDGKYKILNKIGQGGMSVVYMAINEKVNKTWAIKEIRKSSKINFNTVYQGLITEIETLKKLNHRNLPNIIDVIEQDDSFIIVMDYIEGHSLDKILSEYGALPEEYVVKWAIQLCDILIYLHTRNPPIIYRDMKPSNIILKPDGDITLIDFGTAKNYEINLGETMGIGTIGYAAPEQYIGSGFGRTDPKTDIYCFGITLYQLLTNIDPCKNLISDKSILNIDFKFSYGLDYIIKKCTQFDPNDRYENCIELMQDIKIYKDLNPKYKKRQRQKFYCFITLLSLSALFMILGSLCKLVANNEIKTKYYSTLDQANKSANYEEKLSLYDKCINMQTTLEKKDAYLGLIQAFKENDSVFTQDEAEILIKHIKNNKENLQKNNEYIDVCYEVGKLYWYYFENENINYNNFSGAIYASEWFKDIPKGYVGYSLANVYKNIGLFYKNIAKYVIEADDKWQYSKFFNNLRELIKLLKNSDDEREIVKLELVDMIVKALNEYSIKFRDDKIKKDDLIKIFDEGIKILYSVNPSTDKTRLKKDNIITMLDDTKNSILRAYKFGGR